MKELEDTDDYIKTMAHVARCPYRVCAPSLSGFWVRFDASEKL